MSETMTITDEGRSGPKTSLKMTRSISEDIGLKVKDIFEKISDNKIDLKTIEWQWLITQCWSDEIWKLAVNKAIIQAEDAGINLNKNKAFLQLIREKTLIELRAEFNKTHPIAKMSLMELVDKKIPEPGKPKTVEELWP